MEGFAATGATGNSGIRHPGLARLAVILGTAAALVGLYAGTKHFLVDESSGAGQTRAYSLDIGEACMNGTDPPPLFVAREGDRIVLTVTSLYSGELYMHGMEKEINLTPGSETTIIFTARPAGRYYLHLHGDGEDHAHAEAAVLEVAPR
jgi:hypothetical protein